jgi:GDP-mannose 6-dehydrogenase
MLGGGEPEPPEKAMRIAVFGLGYVGSVSGACLARKGHTVCGVDISPEKVRMINEGLSPVVEPGLDRLVSQVVRAGRLRATLSADEAVRGSDVSLVCVGTPSRSDGSTDLSPVLRAADEIGCALRSRRSYHTVAVRSTILPGSMREAVIPRLERRAGQKVERDFGVCFHPAFLREGSSVQDFLRPPRTVIGAAGPRSARRLVELSRAIRGPLFLTSLETAEMVKYADNAFHALKVAFANEIGAISKSFGVDSHEVMRIFIADTKLNLSPLYLKPGFAFGGPCLPKDVRALCAAARHVDLVLPLLSSILPSNALHLQRATDLVLATGKRKIGVLGLVFKSDTDDLRESPACALVKCLLNRKRRVRIYDPRVNLRRLIGANRASIEPQLPGLDHLLVNSARELLASCDAIVVTGHHPEFAEVIRNLTRRHVLIDLVRWRASAAPLKVPLDGICW